MTVSDLPIEVEVFDICAGVAGGLLLRTALSLTYGEQGKGEGIAYVFLSPARLL